MNALFGMRSKISIGDRTIVATVTATACLLSCLPKPSQPKLICTASSTAVQQVGIQYVFMFNQESSSRNKRVNHCTDFKYASSSIPYSLCLVFLGPRIFAKDTEEAFGPRRRERGVLRSRGTPLVGLQRQQRLRRPRHCRQFSRR